MPGKRVNSFVNMHMVNRHRQDSNVEHTMRSIRPQKGFYAPGREFEGIYFCPVCVLVCCNFFFNLGHNLRDRDVIFGMHTELMKSFQMTPR